jgi:TonB family protein
LTDEQSRAELAAAERDSMRRRLNILLIAFTAVVVLAPGSSLGQTNWREVRALKMGRFFTRVDVSSGHTLRLYAQLDTSKLMGEQLAADSVGSFQRSLFNDLDKPTRMQYVLGNTVLVQPFAADSATVGFVLTVADTDGRSRQVVTDKEGMEEFLDMLEKGVAAARTLTDSELMRQGPIEQKPIALAKHLNYVYPRAPKLANQSGSALVQFIVDTTGKAKPESIVCVQATYKDFALAAIDAVKMMEFTPAMLEGHKIEQLVQYPFDFKLNAVLPVKPFEVPHADRRAERPTSKGAMFMKRRFVRASLTLASAVAVLSAAKCGSKGYITQPIPGVGQEVPLVQVDGKAVPTVIASGVSGQTTVIGGKATLGEAIASGNYNVVLQQDAGMSTTSRSVTGNVLFSWTERSVSASIDLGPGLGAHTFTFQRN